MSNGLPRVVVDPEAAFALVFGQIPRLGRPSRGLPRPDRLSRLANHDEIDDFLSVRVRHTSNAYYSAVLHDYHAVGDIEHVTEVVADHQHGQFVSKPLKRLTSSRVARVSATPRAACSARLGGQSSPRTAEHVRGRLLAAVRRTAVEQAYQRSIQRPTPP